MINKDEILIAEKKADVLTKPRLAFLGVGWIGRNRMEAIGESSYAKIAAVSDLNNELAGKAKEIFPDATVMRNYEEILEDTKIDGVVIATPSALHAEQAVRALKSGKAVFCQKPLARDLSETLQVVDAAKDSGKLLAVDFSYRFTNAMQLIYQLVRSGDLGNIYAAQLTFHNAYGPDKDWFYNAELSGGGCVMDLGIHLVDLALWCLDFPKVDNVAGKLFAKGKRLAPGEATVEDYASASIDLSGGTHLNLNCSWNLPAGKEAIIEVVFYGTKGGAAFKNKNGSFYDFTAEKFTGTCTKLLFDSKDNWAGKAATDWARRLKAGEGYDPLNEQFLKVASVIDKIYGR